MTVQLDKAGFTLVWPALHKYFLSESTPLEAPPLSKGSQAVL